MATNTATSSSAASTTRRACWRPGRPSRWPTPPSGWRRPAPRRLPVRPAPRSLGQPHPGWGAITPKALPRACPIKLSVSSTRPAPTADWNPTPPEAAGPRPGSTPAPRSLYQPPVQVGLDQPGPEVEHGALGERRLLGVQAVQHQPPAPVHHRRLDHLVLGGTGVGLQDQRQPQLRRRHRRLPFAAVGVQLGQLDWNSSLTSSWRRCRNSTNSLTRRIWLPICCSAGDSATGGRHDTGRNPPASPPRANPMPARHNEPTPADYLADARGSARSGRGGAGRVPTRSC